MKTTFLGVFLLLCNSLLLQAQSPKPTEQDLSLQFQTLEALAMPLPLVKVCLYQGEVKLACEISDSRGAVNLENVPQQGAGYRLEVKHIGYKTQVYQDWKGIAEDSKALITLERGEGLENMPYIPGVTPRLFGTIYAEDTEEPLVNLTLELFLADGNVITKRSAKDGSYSISVAGDYDSLRVSDPETGYYAPQLIKAPLEEPYGTQLSLFMRSSGKSALNVWVEEAGSGQRGHKIPVIAELDHEVKAKGNTDLSGMAKLILPPYYYYLKIPGLDISERVQVASGEQSYTLKLDSADFDQVHAGSRLMVYFRNKKKEALTGVEVKLYRDNKLVTSDKVNGTFSILVPKAKFRLEAKVEGKTFEGQINLANPNEAVLLIRFDEKGAKQDPKGLEAVMAQLELEEVEHLEMEDDIKTFDANAYSAPYTQAAKPKPSPKVKRSSRVAGKQISGGKGLSGRSASGNRPKQPVNTTANESYAAIEENGYRDVERAPLSTFSIDVDQASYTNIRRHISSFQAIPKDAVRIEEMLNYFDYDYPEAKGKHPFSIYTEVASCPWNADRQLVHIGLQGERMNPNRVPANNLVFLLDVSGSMSSPHKLPLLKKAFNLLVDQLDDKDKVSIVVYAGASGVVLPATAGSDKTSIKAALNQLNAGGSTAGGAGINLAYKIAEEQFIKKGNNRIILATDGDFNVGASNPGGLERLIEEKRDKGIFFTVIGLGMGNYKDDNLERLADKGNGNYAYLDNLREAHKFFVQELNSNLYTIAKDVKLQIEFNPKEVKSYRLIGYENRLLKDEDFNDDTKDAGELGAGHTVTALYEIIPARSNTRKPGSNVDDLKYQKSESTKAAESGELMTIKFRYKEPLGKKSQLIKHSVKNRMGNWKESSDNFRFSAAVAEFGLLLRDSEFKGAANMNQVVELAAGALGADPFGYRAQFAQLVDVYNWQMAEK